MSERTAVPRDRVRLAAALAIAAVLLLSAPDAAAGERSALARPDHPRPPLLTVGPTIGGSPDWQLFRYGASGAILFRPDAAALLMPPLFYWDTGLVLQWEYRDVDRGRSLLAGDVVLRRYLADADGSSDSARLFVGLGGGVAQVRYPPPAPAASEDTEEIVVSDDDGEDRYYALVGEFGYERDLGVAVVLLWKLQWRSYVWGGRDYSNYTIHMQVGIPLPW